MAKSLLYRLFGIGGIPAKIKTELEGEGILVMDEGISGSAIFTNFRSPTRIAGVRYMWFTASLVLTHARILALQYAGSIINVPLTDPRLRSMLFSLQDNDTMLSVRFDAGLFHPDWSGTIEYHFRTPQAKLFLQVLQERLPNETDATHQE